MGNAKDCSNYHTIELISHAGKIMLKILQARLQQYGNWEISDVRVGFRKGRGPEIKLPTSTGSLKKQDNSRKTSTSALLTMPSPLTGWIITNCQKFLKRWEYRNTWPAFCETCMQVKNQQLELQTGTSGTTDWFKLGNEYPKPVYKHPDLTYMQSTSYQMPGWMKHKPESRLPGEI